MLKQIFKDLPIDCSIEVRAKSKVDDSVITARSKSVDEVLREANNLAKTHNLYFGIAPRLDTTTDGKKESCYGINTLYIDLDRPYNVHEFLLPPSYIVNSGNNYHLYWQLNEYITDQKKAERLLKALTRIYLADKAVAQIAAILRIPNTLNHKTTPSREVKLIESNGYIYRTGEVETAVNGNFKRWINKAKTIVQVGERSEHEFQLTKELSDVGYSEQLITHLLKHHSPSTAKLQESDAYLEKTVDKVMSGEGNPLAIYKGDGLYFTYDEKGKPIQLSNFMFDLKAIQRENGGMGNYFIVDIIAGKSVWKNQVLSGKSFTTASMFKQSLPFVQMAWLGNDFHTTRLKMFLSDEWENEGLPLINTTSQVGRQGKHYVTNKAVYNLAWVVQNDTIYVEPKHQHPTIDIYTPIKPTKIFKRLLRLNEPNQIQTMLGWNMAAHVKPVLEKYKIRFPHLMVSGTKGAGKTTLITRVFQPLMGYTHMQTWPANSTPFVLLSLMGTTTSVPICLSEFRSETQRSQSRFLQTLRTAYDYGKESKGRADLSTVDYDLTSPVCIDGEELVTDPALLERTIPVYLDVRNVPKSGTALKEILELDLQGMGSYLLDHILKITDEQVYQLYLIESEKLAHLNVPQRIKDNYAVVNLGLTLINDLTEYNAHILPSSVLLEEASKVAVVDFLQQLINNALSSNPDKQLEFRYTDKEPEEFWFHFSTCYNWYKQTQSRINNSIPPELTLKRQLDELPEGIHTGVGTKGATSSRRVMHMYCINLAKANSILDIDIYGEKD